MKKILAIVLSVAMIVMVSACRADVKTEKQPEKSSSEVVSKIDKKDEKVAEQEKWDEFEGKFKKEDNDSFIKQVKKLSDKDIVVVLSEKGDELGSYLEEERAQHLKDLAEDVQIDCGEIFGIEPKEIKITVYSSDEKNIVYDTENGYYKQKEEPEVEESKTTEIVSGAENNTEPNIQPATTSVAPVPPVSTSTTPISHKTTTNNEVNTQAGVTASVSGAANYTEEQNYNNEPTSTTTETTNVANNFDTYDDTQVDYSISYIGNSNTGKFHANGCNSINKIKPEHIVHLSSRTEAINNGYIACQRCHP